MTDRNIIVNKDKSRVEALDGDKLIGLADFKLKGSTLDAYHTEVNKEYGGQGIAGRLVDELVSHARSQGYKIYPSCSYVKKKFDTDKKYQDVDAR